jgi:peptidyl-prolyl cis-trans isomerase B (cyclophilin B)
MRRREIKRGTAVAALLAGSLALASCGGGGSKGSSASKGGTGATGSGKCATVSTPSPRRVRKQAKPTLSLAKGRKYDVTLETNCGAFTIRLDPRQAPRTGGSFLSLVRKRFYNGLTFHRIVPGFVIQGGDPRGNGTGGPGYTIRERPPADVVYSEGVVAMAKTGAEPAGTSGSQFFVVTSNNAQLPPDYALLGRVTKGLEVVHRIEAVPTGAGEAPTQPVVIKRVTVKVS